MRLGFFGAAGEVTGSCTLVDTGEARFLVDCGMFQGGAEARAKNERALSFGFDVRRLDFVLLTHAHIDHSGLLPRLAMLGFRGPVYTTPATISLLEVLLPDAAHIQEKEAEWQLRNRHRRGRSERGILPPLYTVMQAQAALKLLRPVPYDESFAPLAGIGVRFRDAGHILGSASLEVTVASGGRSRRLVFSGDLGMPGRPVLNDPAPAPASADALLIESTYGNRLHRSLAETEEEIVNAFARTRAAGGNIVIPAFAVGRTQEILFILTDLVRCGRLPAMKVFVDSPMANSATRITLEHSHLLDAPTRELIAWQQAHPHKMDIEFVADVERSRQLNDIRHGAVIISASGMCDAGRIKYHLRENLGRHESTVLIAGFQAAGTLGRRLVDGAKLVRIFGETVSVKAKICTVGGLSAHADQAALLDWLAGFHKAPGKLFVVHGESSASQAFADAIRARFGWREVHLPQANSFVTL